jgi:hypothetical protein
MTFDSRAHRAVQGIHRAVEVMEMSSTKTPQKLTRFDQYRERKSRNQRIVAIAVGIAVPVALLFGAVRLLGSSGGPDVPATPSPPESLTPVVEPQSHVFRAFGDPSFDGAHVITMDLLDGYEGDQGDVVFGSDGGQGISTWTVGNVYADPCHSSGTLLDPPIDSSVHALVASLTNQEGSHATKPTDIEVDGYAGRYMEMTVPAGINMADCDHAQYRIWVDPQGGNRYREAGQRDMLWILNVDGTRLVIDAALGPKTTLQDRRDRTQMVESIQIDPA